MILGMVAGAYLGLLAKNYDIARNRNVLANSQPTATQNSVKDLKIQSQLESATVLFSISDDICEKYNLCDLKGIELICALNDIENPEIEELLSKKQLNIDSIKLKINLSCNCQK
ncbi:MAG: hypothetical protein KDD13_11160 [Mangrovimonas sp.]|nr:hypothetical protein [Mangrovimonas sp.]MCB0539460.1 hypothetical protein [Bacteroidota bacterium]